MSESLLQVPSSVSPPSFPRFLSKEEETWYLELAADYGSAWDHYVTSTIAAFSPGEVSLSTLRSEGIATKLSLSHEGMISFLIGYFSYLVAEGGPQQSRLVEAASAYLQACEMLGVQSMPDTQPLFNDDPFGEHPF